MNRARLAPHQLSRGLLAFASHHASVWTAGRVSTAALVVVVFGAGEDRPRRAPVPRF